MGFDLVLLSPRMSTLVTQEHWPLTVWKLEEKSQWVLLAHSKRLQYCMRFTELGRMSAWFSSRVFFCAELWPPEGLTVRVPLNKFGNAPSSLPYQIDFVSSLGDHLPCGWFIADWALRAPLAEPLVCKSIAESAPRLLEHRWLSTN